MKGSVRSENGEMLEFDDPLEGFAMSTRTRGLQNEVKQQQKHQKTREERRETRRKGEDRSKSSVLEALGSPWDAQMEAPGAPTPIGGAPSD